MTDADPVSVLLMTLRFVLAGDPAVYRCSDVLCCAGDDGEYDEKQYGVPVMQPVDDVVIVTVSVLRQLRHGRYHPIHVGFSASLLSGVDTVGGHTFIPIHFFCILMCPK